MQLFPANHYHSSFFVFYKSTDDNSRLAGMIFSSASHENLTGSQELGSFPISQTIRTVVLPDQQIMKITDPTSFPALLEKSLS
jgi:hypothetical protein